MIKKIIKRMIIVMVVAACAVGFTVTAMAEEYESVSNSQSVNISNSFIDGNLNIFLYNYMLNGGEYNINEDIYIDNVYIGGDMTIYQYTQSQYDNTYNNACINRDFRGMPPKVF